MSIDHLKDKQIQQYLDNKQDGLDADEMSHLESCEGCQASVAEYEHLYRALGTEEPNLLSVDFAAKTMARIRAEEGPVAGIDRSVMWLSIIGVLSCLSVIIYFVDVKALLDSMSSLSVSSLIPDLPIAASIKSLSDKLGGTLPILIFAGMLLAGAGIADKLLDRQKTTRAYFLSI